MIELIQQRLTRYEEGVNENSLKEIIQEIALFGLWRAGFFEVAAFQGGTSLRILHDLPRFSEDMDFILLAREQAFSWDRYLGRLLETLNQFGIDATVNDRGKLDSNIQRAVIKDDSLVDQLDLVLYRGPPDRKLQIKLEVDINPPANSGFDFSFLDFPSDFEIRHQDLESNFALKIHALLCRKWDKGRDWFDFSWYIRNRVAVNLPHLEAALMQAGPWAGTNQKVDIDWLGTTLAARIDTVDWTGAVRDVERFLNSIERDSLGLWSARFFRSRLDVLLDYIVRS